MRHTIIKLLSKFITNDKKQLFKEKYDPIERNKAYIRNVEKECLKIKESNIIWYAINKLKNISAINLSYTNAFNNGYLNSYKEHEANVENLKRNLDKEALTNLNKILCNIEKADRLQVKIPELWLTEDEKKEYYKELEMQNQIIKTDNYYQYKNYKLPVNFFQASLFMYNNGMHKIKTLNKMNSEDVIIDAGYCIADSALIMRDFIKNKIIGFEPTEENCDSAKKTVELNNLKDVICEQYGLGNKNEDLYFTSNPSDAFDIGAVGITKNENSNKCKIIKLDDYVKKYNLRVGLIKSDIEGFEPNLLEGAIETIKTQRPILLISIYHNYNDFYKIKPWIESLNLGYKFDFYHGLYADPDLETLLIAEVY